MMFTYFLSNKKKCDQGIPDIFLLLGMLNRNLYLGFSTCELDYGPTVCGRFKLLKEKLLGQKTKTSLLNYVSKLKEIISQTWTMANEKS